MNPLYFASIAQFIHAAADFILSSWINTALTSFLGLGGVDTILRIVKTDKPVTILVGIRKVLGMGRSIAHGVINLLSEIEGLIGAVDKQIDRLIPQRLKEPTVLPAPEATEQPQNSSPK